MHYKVIEYVELVNVWDKDLIQIFMVWAGYGKFITDLWKTGECIYNLPNEDNIWDQESNADE